MIEANDLALFKKLGAESISDLALLVPKSFDDYHIYTKLIEAKQVFDISIQSWAKAGHNLKVEAFAHNINASMQMMIFHPKPFHYATFAKKERFFIFGQAQRGAWGLSVTQPLKISKINTIYANFSSAIRNDSHQKLVQKYIKSDYLISEGLPQSIAHELVALFFPKQEDIARYNEEGPSAKARYALKFTELFTFMNRLSKKRTHFEPLKTQALAVEPFLKSLPFCLTQDQLQSIEDIYQDLQAQKAARRMVIGDVGSGKTMVILATAFMNQKQKSLLMAPTLLLALQLYEEAERFLPMLKIVLVTNKHNKKLDLEAYDFIIGTHALLYKKLPTCNVVMIDEQHRFGTKQRHLIEKLVSHSDKKPHLFQFSATPIPRTQAMVNSALLDVSLIQETPFSKDISTKVIGKEDFSKLLEHIRSEIALNHQILIVYPLVEESDTIIYQSIEQARAFWESNFTGVFVTHGQDKNKDEVLLGFRDKGHILLSTTVVEVGISLPKLSTVVIVGAERMGLATLHQLRGRVSRTGLKGYCYLFTYAPQSERLEAFSRLKSGFDIAALDLKYRSSGDLLSGTRQSGAKYLWFDESEDEAIVKAVQKYRQEKPVKA